MRCCPFTIASLKHASHTFQAVCAAQVYTAEEKAALAMVNFEENKRKVLPALGFDCFH